MSLRITTNGTLHSYKSNLMRSYKKLTDANEKVLTQRNFNSYAEDPAAASQAFSLRRSLWLNESQLTNSNAVINRFNIAWDAVDDVVNDLGDKLTQVSALRGLSGSTASGRKPLGETLKSAAQAIVQTMNARYGDNFVFAGADGLNVPFSLGEDGSLLFRGVPVDAAEGTPEYDKLKAMSEESTFVDLGLGLSEDGTGKLVESSAFDSSLSGLNILGYGVDEDGDPKNVVSLAMEIGKIFSNCDADSGAFNPPEAEEDANRLTDKLQAALSNSTLKHTELDTKAAFLNTNTKRLNSMKDTLNAQISGIEDINGADAISSLAWAQYCYNAALKIGNSIVSQSLIDYMN